MAYSLHIHRRTDWSDCEPDITFAEWQALCAADPTLELTGAATARNPHTGEIIAIPADGMARWDGPVTAWFNHAKGRITVDGAHEAVVAKAVEIAVRLDARVQGDEGEFYAPDHGIP